jgi:hypothetical protein
MWVMVVTFIYGLIGGIQVVYRAIYDAQCHLNSRLSSVIRDGLWFWKPARSDALVEIQSKLFMVDFGVGDEPKWVIS